jgi:hypothetical protein
MNLPVGTNYCLCRGCGEFFGGVRAFDRHRQGPANARNCADPASLTTKKGRPLLSRNQRGYWVGSYG